MGFFRSFGMFGQGGRGEGKQPAQPPPTWTEVLGPPERLARFEDGVRRYFARQGVEAEIGEGQAKALSGPFNGEVFGLTNLSQMCAQQPEDAWAGVIARHFMMIKRTGEDGKKVKAASFEEVRDQLVVRLWERDRIGTAADFSVCREDIPGLLSMLALDLPESIMSVSCELASGWGVPDDQLFAAAMRNLARTVEPHVDRLDFGPEGSAWVIQAESYYTASLALDFDRFAEARGAFGTIVTIPVRNALLAVPIESIDSITSIGPLLVLTHKLERDGPGSISRRAWWRREGRWSELPCQIKDGQLHIAPTEEQVALMNRLAEPS